ncbi:MAG: L,D-transpeptidase, partial [Patescibacteria group bacterium]|nr:L,D-transpeptidase [Patescibacteria group bacterium]
MELNFHTNLLKADTDEDGHSDGDEIVNGYDPLQNKKVKLSKRIEINTQKQELSYFLSDVRMNTFVVSTGKSSMPTPKGHFKIDEKHERAWSANYGLWMPYWMSLNKGRFGIHELPEWPSGYKEGADHLGQAVSHGCIRLGVGDAEFLYKWAEVGIKVFIY